MDKKLTLKLDGVSKSFAKIEGDSITSALSNIDLEMHEGEFVSLVGTSGCGKSTLLRLITGLIAPTTGSITINGSPVTGPGPDRGMVFQKPTLFPWLTVEKNLAFGLRMQGRLENNRDKVEQMLHLIGLESSRNDYPGQLSGGMAQRVELARAMIGDADILLMDEPLSALDAFTRMNMQDEILDMWSRRRQLVVMVTHDVDEAVYMGTRVLVMEPSPGKIKAEIPIELSGRRNRSSSLFVEYRNHILELLDYGAKE